MKTRYVYEFHFDQPISDKHTTQHYIGSANDVEARYREHLAGKGAKLTQVALEKGISFHVVRVWDAGKDQGRKLERKLKSQHNGPRLCPLCHPKKTSQSASILQVPSDV